MVSADVGWRITVHTHWAGWRALTQPQRSRAYLVFSHWQEWSEQLDPAGIPLSVALPEERPLSAFYRQNPSRPVNLRLSSAADYSTAEQFIGQELGWTIVPATRFLGSEGRVKAAVWLLEGDETNPFGVAAYRRFLPGEKMSPVIYRHKHSQNSHEISQDFLVKTWNEGPVNFSLFNPSGRPCAYTFSTPLELSKNVVANQRAETLAINLPAGKISEVVFSIKLDPSLPEDQGSPEVEFAP